MPKLKTLNCEISGLFQHCSPLRCLEHKGLAIRSKTGPALFKIENTGELAPVYWSERTNWTLDLRDLTGAFHAAMYIDDHRDKFEPKDFSDALNDELGPDYHHVYLKAGTGGLLTAAERKALSKIVLWVAERVG